MVVPGTNAAQLSALLTWTWTETGKPFLHRPFVYQRPTDVRVCGFHGEVLLHAIINGEEAHVSSNIFAPVIARCSLFHASPSH